MIYDYMRLLSCKEGTPCLLSFILLVLLCCFSLELCSATDSITPTKFLKDPEAITSASGIFKLGFFSPQNTTNRYVGIWYNELSVMTVIWVANREKPLNDSSGMLTISQDGNLHVLDGRNKTIWSSNATKSAINSTGQLLDSGNLVLREMNDNDNGNVIWESFEHPSAYFMPTMKISKNVITNEKQALTSWKSPSNPSTGGFSLGIDNSSITEGVIWNGNRPYWRTGPWNGQIFTGIATMDSTYYNGFIVVDDRKDTVYVTYGFANKSTLSNYLLNSQGTFLEMNWDDELMNWKVMWSAPETECDFYGKCGHFGICNARKSPICSCLRGFEPKYIEEWNRGNWSSGCLRRSVLKCVRNTGKADGFLKIERVKLPYFAEWKSMSLSSCESLCLQSCSCMAYAYDPGIGCMSWSVPLIDIAQQFSPRAVDLYVRVAHSDMGKKTQMKVIVITTATMGIFTVAICAYCLWRRIASQSEGTLESTISQVQLQDLPLFNFRELVIATNNFDSFNKLGQGGFGPVYKGKLMNGQEIAVKRLSKASGQGQEEFRNEVGSISKLQHRNLVRLLGCCVEGEEKMLVYEYMPNKSLDAFLFDPHKKDNLDRRKRFKIIEGIGRGLLYLHRDSRLKIIHRDLKANNILLDEDLNPKISDFGMARIFGGKQDQAKTQRVVGTYGYMSPEYALEGRFSEKSDVFSFGVLLLEIVSGRKITSFYGDESPSLLAFAWELWTEGKIAEFTDEKISEPCPQAEILRCIHVGLLCVQELAQDRPPISTVLSMLSSEIAELPTPQKPAFISRRIGPCVERQSQRICSTNEVTVTVIEGR